MEKWILYFSKKGKKFDKIISLSETTSKLWKHHGFLIQYEEDTYCEDYLEFEGTKKEAKSYADSLRNRNGRYIIKQSYSR